MTDEKVAQKHGGTHGETGMSRRKTVLRFAAPKLGIGAGAGGSVKFAECVKIGTPSGNHGFETLCNDFGYGDGGKNGRQRRQYVGNARDGELKYA